MKQHTQSGFSLLELLVATSILLVVSALSFVVLQSSTENNVMSGAKAEVNGGLRDVLGAITSEVRTAYTQRTTDSDPPLAHEDAIAVQVWDGGSELEFMVPEPSTASAVPTPSSRIIIRWENEDTNGNGELDPGEDANADGVLTRRVVREQDGETLVLGSANNISGCFFSLEESIADDSEVANNLVVWLAGTKKYGPGEERAYVQAQLETRIKLEN